MTIIYKSRDLKTNNNKRKLLLLQLVCFDLFKLIEPITVPPRYYTIHALSSQKQVENLREILQVKANLGKYLK